MLFPLIGLVILILDIVAIVKVLGGSGTVERKILWTVVILILPLIGMILYFALGERASDA